MLPRDGDHERDLHLYGLAHISYRSQSPVGYLLSRHLRAIFLRAELHVCFVPVMCGTSVRFNRHEIEFTYDPLWIPREQTGFRTS